MKYKPGDLVTIRKDLKGYKKYGKVFFAHQMEKYRGNTYKIEKTISVYNKTIYYLIGVNCWSFSPEMFVRSWKDKYEN